MSSSDLGITLGSLLNIGALLALLFSWLPMRFRKQKSHGDDQNSLHH
jgi:hypothetical protein